MKSDCTKASLQNLRTKQCFSEEDQKRYQEIFAQEAQEDRRLWRKTITIFFICLVIYTFIGSMISNYPIAKAFWIIGLFVIPMPALTPAFLASKELKCPACRKKLFRSGEDGCNYCPECGSASLKVKGWIAYHYCDSCGKRFTQYRYSRNYKIRFCTYCGLLFSKKGY